ncbi:MAG: Rad52/Rad22 family DNA repair protein, partial [Solirubrobacteraceae bacterium]
MTPTPHPTHHGPYTELTAEAARDLRRPISPDELRFKVQAVRWNKRDGQDRVATAAQVVAYIDARTVVARLNLLFPGRWQAPTNALPLEMRLTRRNADGTLTPIRLTDQGEVKADHTLYYRCRLAIADAAFEDVGAGDDPKAAYSDAIKRVAVRAGIGESLYAMDSPWLRVGDADNQLRVSRAGKPYLDERNTRWLRRMYEAWLTRAGAIFGEPLPHAPAPTLPGAPETTADDAPAAQTTAPAAAGASDAADGNLAAVSAPEIPDIPGLPAASDGAEPAAEEP